MATKNDLTIAMVDSEEFDIEHIGFPLFGHVIIGLKELRQLHRRVQLLKQSRDTWKAKYDAITSNITTFDSKNEVVILSTSTFQKLVTPNEEQNVALAKTQAEAQFYKEKYADEVQKRLELLKYLDHIEISPSEPVESKDRSS